VSTSLGQRRRPSTEHYVATVFTAPERLDASPRR